MQSTEGGSIKNNAINPELYHGFELSECRVFPQKGTIERQGRNYHLAPKAMETLLFLVANQHQTCSAEEILEFVWGDKEHHRGVLTHAISEIRHALDDHKECPQYIQTHAGVGYRLIAAKAELATNVAFPSFWNNPPSSVAQHSNGQQKWHLSFSLLKSSRLFSVSIAFAISTWAIIQILEVLFPIFNVPNWGLQIAVLILIIGFPLVLLFTWLRELKNKKILLQQDNSPQRKKFFFRQLAVDFTIIGLMSIGIGFLAIHLFDSIDTSERQIASTSSVIPLEQPAAIPINDNAIVLFPFKLSTQNELPAYFINTYQSEMANSIAHFTSFDVVSQRITNELLEQFSSTQIIKKMGARYIIDGSINEIPLSQKLSTTESSSISSAMVRVQLILTDTKNYKVLWTKTINQPKNSLLDLQQQMQNQVVEQLISMRGSKVAQVNTINTKSADAYEFYIQGQNVMAEATNMEDFELAEKLFIKSLSLDRDFTLASSALCNTYLEKYEYSKAVNDFETAKTVCNNSLNIDMFKPEPLTALGNLYRISGDDVIANSYFEQALEQKPNYLAAITGKALNYVENNQTELGEQYFKKAIALDPGHWKGYQNYGDFLFGVGRYKEAIDQYQWVIYLDKNNAETLNRIGAAYYLNEDFSNAINFWEESIELETSARAHSNLGTAYYFNGQFNEAEIQYLQAVALVPDDATIWSNLGDSQKQLNLTERAFESFEHALTLLQKQLEVNPTNTKLLTLQAKLESEIGACTSAINYFNQLFDIDIDDPYIYYRLGVGALNCEKYELAHSFFERSIDKGYSLPLLNQDPQYIKLKHKIN